MNVSDDRTLIETVRAERAAAKLREQEREGGITFETGYTIGHCIPFRMTDAAGHVSTGFISARNAPRKRCQVCKEEWSIAQCDFPTGARCRKCKGAGQIADLRCHDCAGTGRAMCNCHLCDGCRANAGADEDYCPEHAERAGLNKLALKPSPAVATNVVRLAREECAWHVSPRLVRRDCLHAGCSTQIIPGERALYFPRRARAMCPACGERYLSLTKTSRAEV